ncbi:MAG: hypothetical protein HY959_02065 [Ignavibacteriae bacterium]|nr:hypothetical protein [Ignavibacteriota bacterium]
MRLKDGYYLGSFGCGEYGNNTGIYFYYDNSLHWSNYNNLSFNINHQYIPSGINWEFEENTQGYTEMRVGAFKNLIEGDLWTRLNNLFNLSYNNSNGQKLILERIKTNFAGYGQRSTICQRGLFLPDTG